jgi:hypothetical protein
LAGNSLNEIKIKKLESFFKDLKILNQRKNDGSSRFGVGGGTKMMIVKKEEIIEKTN